VRADLGVNLVVVVLVRLCAVAYLPIGEGRGMVRTSGRDCAGIAPDYAMAQSVGKIAGGFVLVSVAALVTAWRACRVRPLGTGDFRAWLACHELEGRRCVLAEGRAPAYNFAELARLLDVSVKRARASVRRLEAAGLIRWSDSAIVFLDPRDDLAEGLEDTIGRGRGSVAIPRRMLRFLVAGARPALIATVLGLLLRCLSRRKGGFDGRGRVKASWIARTFGVSIPAVKVARRELIALGWIVAEPGDQWAENRWGRAYSVNLGWQTPTTSSGPSSIPPRPAPGSTSIPPDLQTGNPSGRAKNQEPAGTGSSIKGSGDGEKTVQAPTLADVRLDDLKDTARLLDLYRQAVAKGLVTASEGDRLRFVGAAEHALAVAKHNPPGLFAWLVRGACWRYVTQDDEDRARQRLRLHDFGPPKAPAQPSPFTTFSSSRPIEAGGLSDDARIVKAIREASIKAGLYRDPFPAFQACYPGWTRGRWDAALAELGLRSHAPPVSE
jgi:hypothetical protein